MAADNARCNDRPSGGLRMRVAGLGSNGVGVGGGGLHLSEELR